MLLHQPIYKVGFAPPGWIFSGWDKQLCKLLLIWGGVHSLDAAKKHSEGTHFAASRHLQQSVFRNLWAHASGKLP